MRKLLTGAIVASATLAIAAGAVAQAPDPAVSLTAKVSPSKAGKTKKPKNHRLTFNMKVAKPGTTVEFIDLTLPKKLKLSGRGLGNCTPDDLSFEGPAGCKGDEAGPAGTANAVLSPLNTPLTFQVVPFVQDKDTLLFYVAGLETLVQSPITGEITSGGRKLRITIPKELRQPVEGNDASLTGLEQTFFAKKGKKRLVSSTGCTGRKHKFTGVLTFTQRADGAAVPPPSSTTGSASCKK